MVALSKPSAILSFAFVLFVGFHHAAAQDDLELPKYEDMEVPTVKELLLEPPVDWIRLKTTDEVIVTKTIYPRPDTIKKLEQQIQEINKVRPRGMEELEEWRKKRDALNYVNIVMTVGDATEFRLDTKRIEEIIYHEELLLRRVDLLVKADEQRKAFELLYKLERRLPNWPGLADRKNDMMFNEAEGYREKKQHESALVFYEQLHDRKPDYPELKTRLGEMVDVLVERAVTAEDFRKARHFLGRLSRRESDHPIAKKWKTNLEDKALALLKKSEQESMDGKHSQAAATAAEAIGIWPDATGLRSHFTKAWRRYQTLHAGVMQLPGEPTEFFLSTAGDQRAEYLTRSTLFDVSSFRGTPRYSSPYVDQWEPKDLGRRAVFKLRAGRRGWESRPDATANDFVFSLKSRLDPTHEFFNERLASYVDSIQVTSPLDCEIEFARVPLRTEALLNFPLMRTPFEAEQYEGPEAFADLLSARFLPEKVSPDTVRYLRATPEPNDAKEYHVAEIVEHKYQTHEEAIKDLLRGKLDMIPRARIWHIDQLEKANRFFVLKNSLPRVHVLQFNPKSKPLQNREFRRSIAHAIHKDRILYENILQKADLKHARLVTAPYNQRSYAYNPLIEPREYNLTLAVALRLASQRALGGEIPTLRMVCDPDPTIIAAAQAMIADWKRIGIPVRLLNNSGQIVTQDSEEWDIVYRTTTMPEPLTELWSFFTMQESARIEDLKHLPDWLRQELIQLDTANDWKSAAAQLKRLHRLLWAEVQIIPLWEVDEYAIYRKHLEGYRREAVEPYQNIEQWTVEPWIPPEAP